MVWNIPRMWEGGECWIIGGGPSIPYEFGVPEDVIHAVQSGELPLDAYSPYLSPIHDKHVIGVNAAFLLGSWMDMMFFGDGKFYWNNLKALRVFPKPKVTMAPVMKDHVSRECLKWILRDMSRTFGLSRHKNSVCWGKNSGAAAINFAYHLGVKRIFLLGFDMTFGEHHNQHWHRHYCPAGVNKDPKSAHFHRHMPAFGPIAVDAKKLGLEIYNVSKISVMNMFEKITVEEALNL
jgi:hypothetical protein